MFASYCLRAQENDLSVRDSVFFWKGQSYNTSLYYSNTDTLLAIGNYLPGTKIKNGKWVYFYRNGKVSREIYFKNDLKRGIWFYYNEDGSLLKKEKWSEHQSLFEDTFFENIAGIINSLAKTKSQRQRALTKQQTKEARNSYKKMPEH